MHELSLCENLLEQVLSIAQQNKAKKIESITINIGGLSGVEPLLLENAFAILKLDTLAEQAQLIINHTPIVIECHQCGNQSMAIANQLLCNVCQSADTHLISGDELILANVSLYTVS